MHWGGYHATTADFAGFETGRDTTGLGFFLTASFEEASGRFCEDGGIVLDIEADFADPGNMDEIIRDLALEYSPGVLGFTRAEIELTAREEALDPARAACQGAYGPAFNGAVAEEARRRGHDALFLDGEPDWAIALDIAALRVIRRLDQEGHEAGSGAPMP